MSKKLVDEEHSLMALKEMLRDRNKKETVGEVLTVFCERYGLSIEECRRFYDLLVERGEIKE